MYLTYWRWWTGDEIRALKTLPGRKFGLFWERFAPGSNFNTGKIALGTGL